MKWYGLIFLAIVIEGVITYAKTLIVNKVFQWQILASMAFGVGCSLAFRMDLFALAGIEAAVPYVGQALTGILLSRGSNYVFDILGQLTAARTKVEAAQTTSPAPEHSPEDGGVEPVTVGEVG